MPMMDESCGYFLVLDACFPSVVYISIKRRTGESMFLLLWAVLLLRHVHTLVDLKWD